MKFDRNHPENACLVAHHGGPGIDSQLMLPEQHPDPHYGAGCHPDVVERMWGRLASRLPVNCLAVIYGVPSLVHPEVGVALAIGWGTAYALRIPTAVIAEGRRPNGVTAP